MPGWRVRNGGLGCWRGNLVVFGGGGVVGATGMPLAVDNAVGGCVRMIEAGPSAGDSGTY